MVSLTQIEYILTLNEQKNFQKAADKCYITQPTLSMQIKKAEETLGYKIFDRSTNPISLTVFGNEIISELRDIKESVRKLDYKIKRLEGNLKEEIRIGIIPTIAVYLVPEFYNAWKTKLKEIRIEIMELKTEDLIDQLENRKIDFGILAGPLSHERFEQQILFNEQIKVFTKDIKSSKIELDQLAEMHPWLLAKGNCLRTQMVSFCNIKEDEIDDWHYAGGNIDLLIKMVLQEGGYTLTPEYYDLPDHLKKYNKSIKNHSPFRQVIGVFNKGTSKSTSIHNIIAEIQRSRSSSFKQNNMGELLLWS
jgi:LysR family hydrogen peroxide-inducible transcriptional activator